MNFVPIIDSAVMGNVCARITNVYAGIGKKSALKRPNQKSRSDWFTRNTRLVKRRVSFEAAALQPEYSSHILYRDARSSSA